MKAVGKHFSKVVQPAYNRHGAAWAGLLSNWATIIGSPLSDFTAPEKVSWPGQARAPQSAQPTSLQAISRSQHQKIGGTLVVKVAYGRALEVQHTTFQILDRINAYYGYQAIAQIKIIQGKISKVKPVEKAVLPALNQAASDRLDERMVDIENENLKHALKNLAKGVLGKSTAHSA